MAKTKYAHLVKTLPFTRDAFGYRQGTELDGAFLGLDVHIKYGAFWAGGKVGEAPYGIHKHDFNQVLLWLGADCADLSELGAEVEISLGEKAERERAPFFYDPEQHRGRRHRTRQFRPDHLRKPRSGKTH